MMHICVLFWLATTSFTIAAFTVDFGLYQSLAKEFREGEYAELDSIFETFLDNAGFEELMENYGRDVKDIYEKNIEKSIQLVEWLGINKQPIKYDIVLNNFSCCHRPIGQFRP